MTKVKRKLRQSPYRLIRACVWTACVLTAAVLLFEMDAFREKRLKRKFNSNNNNISPEQVLLNQEQEHLMLRAESMRRNQQEWEQQQQKEAKEEEKEAEEEEEEEEEENGEDKEEEAEEEEEQEEEENEDEEVDKARKAAEQGEKKEEEIGVEGDESPVKQQQQQPATNKHRRFLMRLGGLPTGDSDGSIATHDVLFETRSDWAPIGVAHFHRLIEEARYYDQCRFFRVLPKFVVQFGIAADPAVQQQWKDTILKDDPVVQSNLPGTLTFATSGPNTRTTQLFINLGNNAQLDKQGFAPIGRILNDGIEWIEKINAKYRQKPAQGKIVRRGNEYLREEFPDLSFIESIRPVSDGEQQQEWWDVM